MKKLLFILTILLSVVVHGQSCERQFIPALGISYVGSKNYPLGAGVEVALIGDEVPVIGGIGFSGYKKVIQNDKGTTSSGIVGNINTSVGVRLYRKDYSYSIFALATGYMNWDIGLGVATSLRFILPAGTKAFSVEPFYQLVENDYGIKLNFHIQL